jgi:dihydrofolate reductase
MRRIRYRVASSLDGYIAGPDGEYDWIVADPEINIAGIFKQFDTLLIGRGTFELMVRAGQSDVPGMKTYVFSHSLRQENYPYVSVVTDNDLTHFTSALKKQEGRDIWLFGGGLLFRSFLNAGLVDTVEVAVIPVLLGAGIPLLPSPANQAGLKLTAHKVYKSGIVSLEYEVR